MNYYPTARFDYQANSNPRCAECSTCTTATCRATRGIPASNRGARLHPTYYIVGTGADWTISPQLFNQLTVGYQSNFEEFNPGNTLAIYEPQGDRRVNLPLMTSPQITDDAMPIPRNNPVYNISNTLTHQGSSHLDLRRHLPAHDDVRGDRRRAAYRDTGPGERRSGG